MQCGTHHMSKQTYRKTNNLKCVCFFSCFLFALEQHHYHISAVHIATMFLIRCTLNIKSFRVFVVTEFVLWQIAILTKIWEAFAKAASLPVYAKLRWMMKINVYVLSWVFTCWRVVCAKNCGNGIRYQNICHFSSTSHRHIYVILILQYKCSENARNNFHIFFQSRKKSGRKLYGLKGKEQWWKKNAISICESFHSKFIHLHQWWTTEIPLRLIHRFFFCKNKLG